MSLLKVNKLKTYFFISNQEIKAVDGISFNVERNETLAIVGESGSGKSVTALSIMRLINPPGEIIEGEVEFNNINLLKFSEKQMCVVRGDRISMIYQEPMMSLNPTISVGEQKRETLIIHKAVPKGQSRQ